MVFVTLQSLDLVEILHTFSNQYLWSFFFWFTNIFRQNLSFMCFLDTFLSYAFRYHTFTLNCYKESNTYIKISDMKIKLNWTKTWHWNDLKIQDFCRLWKSSKTGCPFFWHKKGFQKEGIWRFLSTYFWNTYLMRGRAFSQPESFIMGSKAPPVLCKKYVSK